MPTLHLTDTLSRRVREKRYWEASAIAAGCYEVPHALVLAVMRVESDFKPNALSSAGAVGLMQLMPDTFAYLTHDKLNENLAPEALWDPDTNLRYGTYYLSYLLARFPHLPTALAAYNAGEGNVERWLEEQGGTDGMIQRIPFPETQRYVAKTIDFYERYEKRLNGNKK